jgi:HD-like signal output (HDOD) protein
MADVAAVLLARHERLTSRAGSAVRVLEQVDDPEAGAQEVARSLGTDPVLAARVLRVANSAYYGVSGRVSTLPFAVSVLGFQTVRTIAVTAAAGLDDPAAVPDGFWEGAALSATAGQLVAPLVGADEGEAFSAGLLHTLGAALLHQHESRGLLCLPEPENPAVMVAEEQEYYGITHDQAAARVLGAWHVPEPITVAIGRHHAALLPDAPPLERALQVARLLADAVLRDAVPPVTGDLVRQVTEGAVSPEDLPVLLDRVRDRAGTLLEGLRPRER